MQNQFGIEFQLNFVSKIFKRCTPKGVRFLLYIYAVGIFVLFLVMFAISVFFMAKRDAFETTIKNGIAASMNSYDGQSNESPIDFLQAHVISIYNS